MYPIARRLLAALCFAIASLGLVTAASAQVPYAQLSWGEPRYAAIVVDANSGEVLYARNADSQRHPASITKIMTMYLAFEALSSGRLQLTDPITISAHAASMAPTKLGLRPGETITVDDALRAIAVKSANDMAVALAEKLGGDEQRFSALMTLRAQELGMTNTHFVNASGLPDSRQISSARDIALLSRSVMRDFPQFYSYFGLHQFTYRGATLSNHNHLLDSMPGVDGLKTGFTNASGYNLAASAVQNGRRLIAVVMGGNTSRARDANVTDLLQTGFMVMARRDRGENIQLAQNLFEPEPTGPLMRPQIAQGDADPQQQQQQRGLRIVLTNEVHPSPLAAPVAMRPIANPPQPIKTEVSDDEIAKPAPVKLVRVTEIVPCKAAPHGRKGRHAKAERHKTCETSKLVKASDVKPCKTHGKGRHRKTECAAVQVVEASERGARGHADKAVLKSSRRRGGDWMVQVGAFKDKAQARKQLAKMSHSFSDQFADADTDVQGASGGMFRARFTGFSQAEAKDACALLKAHGHTCMAKNAG